MMLWECKGEILQPAESEQHTHTHTDTSMLSWIRVEHCGKEPHQEHCQFAQGTS